MAKILLLDSNVIIDFANKKPGAVNLDALIAEHKCAASFIVKLETLGFSDITEKEERAIAGLLSKLPILPTNEVIETETIQIRRKQN